MTLRKLMVVLPCAALLSIGSIAIAEDASDNAAEEVETQEQTVLQQIYQALDDEDKPKLESLMQDVQGVAVQLQELQPELNQKHSEIISILKEMLDLEYIPFNLPIQLGDASQEAHTEEAEEVPESAAQEQAAA